MPSEPAAAERRRQTRNNIYRHIYAASDFCSKQSLARDLELSLPTVYQHLTELMDAGLVGFSGQQRYTGGRSANGLAIIPDARIAVGASVTESRLRLVAADLRLNELAYRSIPHDFAPQGSEYGVFLARALEVFLDEEGLDRSRLLGVGIALPGIISSDDSRITLAPTLNMRDVTITGLTTGIPYPFRLENDGTCSGLAEWFKRRGRKNMAYLSLENGVGGAVLANRTAYAGDNCRSGEFGHMCVEPGGLPCKCGKRGCLEAYCSASRISSDLGIALEDFFAGVEHHELEYETLWNDVLRHLAIGVNNIRMALDCDVILGGYLTEYLVPYLPLLRRYVAANNTFENSADYLQLSILRRHTVPLGAALLFIQDFLEDICQ